MKEAKLIKQYMNENELNMEKVMKDYTPYLYSIINHKENGLTEEDMEEIISDTFLALWKNQERLEKDREMSYYLAGTIKRIYSKKRRNLRTIIRIEDYENCLYEAESLEDRTEKDEKNLLIESKLNEMKEEDKNIFIAYYYYSRSIKEISSDLKISELKVKSRLFRIRRKLKKVLEQRGYSY